jgi:hypothetical protein
MSVIRLPGRDLFVHSPAELADELRATFDRLGSVASRNSQDLWIGVSRDLLITTL